ncbi:MAG TPA: DUF4349 domain-containing protein [Candidatus Limnocylindrales bacterium]|nr:DUF4349 domain-containing protein [Candidatus Limnocylindrales bacterium]
MKPSIYLSRGPLPRLLALLAVLVLVVGCGGGAAGPVLAPIGGQTGPAATAAPAPEEAYRDGSTSTIVDAARPELLVIKTGTLELQVEAVDAAVAAAEAKITALGGYISGSEHVGEGEGVSATITFRIPADRWGAALKALRELALKVVTERTGTEDVTGQVVDLRARIANLQATERALQGIMTQATKIADVLAVQAELTKVRGEIEEATAQKQHLEAQAAYSTLSVRFGLEPEPAVAVAQDKFDPKSEVDRATASLVEILQGLARAGIWFGIVWLPILLVLGVVGLGVWLVARRRLPGRAADGWGGPGAPGGPPSPPTEPAAPAAPAAGG